MPDLASLEAVRVKLPYTTSRADFTVSIANHTIHLNGLPMRPIDALDLSVGLHVAAMLGGGCWLPVVVQCGQTVTVSGGVIYLTARPLGRTDALDLSAALARAVNDTIGATR